MAPLFNSRWKNRKERVNRSTNNGDIVEKAKRDVVGERHLSNYRKTELPKITKYEIFGRKNFDFDQNV